VMVPDHFTAARRRTCREDMASGAANQF